MALAGRRRLPAPRAPPPGTARPAAPLSLVADPRAALRFRLRPAGSVGRPAAPPPSLTPADAFLKPAIRSGPGKAIRRFAWFALASVPQVPTPPNPEQAGTRWVPPHTADE
ncbi:hypothetical protein GCM10010324_56590 [Streptomyces hiroshimensis]|uniref:Uncharacterized protein n=1 Tax=Streptomyces hiroshimensis TaxID=66424 RepID=A0ABQ2Z5Y7_9ACTN|nr:hypothetical protein GCM10010324_56590 [Streptomyces hiroshimensis]